MHTKALLKFTAAVMSAVMVLTAVSLAPIKSNFTASAASSNPTADCSVGDVIEFGSYPSSEVVDTDVISFLNELDKTWTAYEYYYGMNSVGSAAVGNYMYYCDIMYNGEKYRGVYFTEYRPYYTYYSASSGNSYIDDNGYSSDTVYWFKYESLKWRVLDPDDGLVLCESIVDAQPYQSLIYKNGSGYYCNSDFSVYANNYAESSVRIWLNNDFYNTAFSSSEKVQISPSDVDNSASDSVYGSGTTSDKIFLLSFAEATNSDYGFSSSSGATSKRQAKGTDYAKIQGLADGYWRLRTAGTASDASYNVNNFGLISKNFNANITYSGIRPAFRFNTAEITVDSVTLDKDELILKEKETTALTATVLPEDCIDKSVVWYSSHPDVAVVSTDGTVIAKSAGDTVITVTAVGGFTAQCKVTVEHDYTISTTDPTCTEDGCTVYLCLLCGYRYEENIPALGHSYGEWETVTEATVKAKGEEQRVCSVCGETETRDIPKLTAEETTTAEVTTANPAEHASSISETTTVKSEYTTSVEEATTVKSEHAEGNTETTTAEPEATTAKSESTTNKAEATTTEPEATTAKSESTTNKIETTATEPEATTGKAEDTGNKEDAATENFDADLTGEEPSADSPEKTTDNAEVTVPFEEQSVVADKVDGENIIFLDPETTAGEFKSSLGSTAVKVYDCYGWELEDGELIGTGCSVQYLDSEGNINAEYSVIVTGDVDGNGKITAADGRLALRAAALLDTLDELQTVAADMDADMYIKPADARAILRKAARLD